MRTKITFETLEPITINQRNVSNWLFLYCAENVSKKRVDKEDKNRRNEQFHNYKEAIMSDFKYSDNLKKMIIQWWNDEIKWYKKYSKDYTHEDMIYALLYRLQVVFFRNHSNCPFYKETKKKRKPDNKEFNAENQKLFKSFLNQSIKIISNKKEFQLIVDILPYLKRIKKIDITEQLYSSAHKLNNKDWHILKGLVIGGGTGVVASIFLGPVIGGYIGNLAGLSGAAATSYGLALLGGGSLAAGGFGMAGGSIVLGLGFGVSNGVRGALKNTKAIDELNQLQAQILLPISLAIGRIQYEHGDMEIPNLIHKTISKRLKEYEKRLTILEEKLDKLRSEKQIDKVEQSISLIKKSVNIYKTARNMSSAYDWLSGYDIYQEIKKAV